MEEVLRGDLSDVATEKRARLFADRLNLMAQVRQLMAKKPTLEELVTQLQTQLRRPQLFPKWWKPVHDAALLAGV